MDFIANGFFNRLQKREKVLITTAFFYNLLPQNFRLGKYYFLLKADASCVVHFNLVLFLKSI